MKMFNQQSTGGQDRYDNSRAEVNNIYSSPQ